MKQFDSRREVIAIFANPTSTDSQKAKKMHDLIDSIYEDRDEVIGMIESSLATSKMTTFSDSIHKEGLIETLKDVRELLK